MCKCLYLFVGKSASGKTTIADMLEQTHGLVQVSSYCTRPPRYEGEIGHIFVSEEEFNRLGRLAAYTFYNGHHYGTTFKQLDECSTYVIDAPGVEHLLKNAQDYSRPIRVIYFDAAVSVRIERMVDRDASDIEIISRLHNDDTPNDWYSQLDKIVWHYKNLENKDIELYKINANEDIGNVLEQVLYHINENEE